MKTNHYSDPMIIRKVIFFLIITMILLFTFLGYIGVKAATLNQSGTPTPQNNIELLSISNNTCLSCHDQPGQSFQLDNGDLLDLHIQPEEFNNSIHGIQGYACVQCHTTVGNYPHPSFNAKDRRDVTQKLFTSCQRCHANQYELVSDSVHAKALAEGNREAAICTDCHSAHIVKQLNNPQTHEILPEARIWIPQTCAKCHNEIYEKYLTSVHGNALVNESNQDVPTCIDCHGVHNIRDPRTTSYRLQTPELCAQCHTNPKIMAKYGISTNVLDTYVADFHGTSVILFDQKNPNSGTNKPVCYDCHGVHDIKRVDDPEKGLQIKNNLLKRCQVCHPNAGTNFPEAWLSHYIPSPDKYPAVYYVNLFYKIFIPTLLGGMAILVALDFNQTYIKRWLKKGRIKNIFFRQNHEIDTLDDQKNQTSDAEIQNHTDQSKNGDIGEVK